MYCWRLKELCTKLVFWKVYKTPSFVQWWLGLTTTTPVDVPVTVAVISAVLHAAVPSLLSAMMHAHIASSHNRWKLVIPLEHWIGLIIFYDICFTRLRHGFPVLIVPVSRLTTFMMTLIQLKTCHYVPWSVRTQNMCAWRSRGSVHTVVWLDFPVLGASNHHNRPYQKLWTL